MFWFVKCFDMFEATMCSSALQRTHVSDMGRASFAGSVLSPFLNIGDTLASFHILGNLP